MNNSIYTTPIQDQYKSKIEGVIVIKYKENIKFNICKITYELFYDDSYQYIFEPYYDVLDALPAKISQGIPGINLDKRQKVYYRVNMVPSFIAERTMGLDRENLKEELEKVYMSEYNPLEWLIRTDTEYSGDNLIVERYRVPKKVQSINYNDLIYGDVLSNLDEVSKDIHEHTKQLLCLVGRGVDINEENLKIDKNNRTSILQLLIHQFELASNQQQVNNKVNVVQKDEQENNKRKRKIIDDFVIEEIIKELELKIISENEAMDILKVNTKSTLYRRIREYKLKKK